MSLHLGDVAPDFTADTTDVSAFASLAGAAHYYGVLCTEDKGDEHPDARDTLYISVPATAPGFSISGDWDPLGMRATAFRPPTSWRPRIAPTDRVYRCASLGTQSTG